MNKAVESTYIGETAVRARSTTCIYGFGCWVHSLLMINEKFEHEPLRICLLARQSLMCQESRRLSERGKMKRPWVKATLGHLADRICRMLVTRGFTFV